MLHIAINVLILVAVAVPVCVLVYGLFAGSQIGAPSHALPLADDETALDRALSPQVEAHPGGSGLYLISENVEAFHKRVLAARVAERSLDLQYYYWQDDLTGGLLAREALAAADRGVRVRMLIDDINTSFRREGFYRAFNDHPSVEVRLFNPSRNRASSLLRGVELILRVFKATRRMHNKAWIADGRAAIIGGRNVGDAYFDAGEHSNFHDLDMLIVGEAVTQAQAMFDTFWNSDEVVPIDALVAKSRMKLARLRDRLGKIAALPAAEPFRAGLSASTEAMPELLGTNGRLRWIDDAQVIFDPPEKASSKRSQVWLGWSVLSSIRMARASLNVISPYFIPRDNGVAVFGDLVDKGVQVSILTNSLAATDVVATYGAYSRYRKGLLRRGVQLYELRSELPRPNVSLMGSSSKVLGSMSARLIGSKAASLHTKAFTVDGRQGFVGSFNFDPRSIALNTEMGVLFADEVLTEEVNRLFAEQIAPDTSYRLELEGNRLVWSEGSEAGETTATEPRTGFWRRLMARLIRLLPIESQL